MSQSDHDGRRVFGGRYALLHELDRGGMGCVFRALDERLSREVAVKVLLHGQHDENHIRRFEREARAAGSLNHPNIVVVHDAGDQDGEPYLVTELLDGETLRKALSRGALAPARAADLALQVARGLVAAHEHGIVHRDLKPENLFLTRGGVLKILDFGIAQLPRESSGLDRVRTATGAPIGTVSYMSPEQVRGQQVDARSDLFSLGSVLHEMLSGAPPFDRATVLDTGHAVIAEAAPALPSRVSGSLAAIVNRCLKKDPGDRFGSARELAAGLETIAQSSHARSRRRLAIVVSAMVFSAAAGAIVVRELPDLAKKLYGGLRADQRPLVAVADIANSTGEPELNVLSGLLIVSLEQSRRLGVLTRSRFADLARQVAHVEPERIDEILGRDIARRAKVKALLVVGVHRLGSKYVVEMRAIDPERDRYLFTVKEESPGKEGLLAVIDRLSERTRRELGDEPSEEIDASRIAVGEALTMNLEAYQHYVRGLDLNAHYGEFASAVKEWRRALELDPNLAIAHRMLAYALGWYNRPAEAAAHARAALASAARMPEKDRTIVLAMDALDKDDRAKAIHLAEQLAARYPDDKTSQFVAAQVLSGAGELQRAEAAFRRALQLDAGYICALGDFARLLDDSGRVAEAIRFARAGVAARPTAANTAILAWATATGGNVEEAVALAREAIRLDGGASLFVPFWTYQVLAYVGRPDEAERELRRLSLQGATDEERGAGSLWLASLQANLGKRQDALRALSALPPTGPVLRAQVLGIGWPRLQAIEALQFVRSLEQAYWLAPELAFRGDFVAAARTASKLSEGSPPQALYRALLLEHENRREESIEALRTIAAAAVRPPTRFFEAQVLYLLGEVLLAADRPAEAIEAMKPLRGINTTWGGWFEVAENWPRAVLVRAQAYERLGQISDAVGELDGLLATWKNADPDLPLLADARAMRARLGPIAAVAR